MTRQVLAGLRAGYRHVVPESIRKLLRRTLSHPGPEPAPIDLGPRRFRLPLPRLEDSGPATPSDLIIEAPRKLYITRHLHEGGVRDYEPQTAAVMLGLVDWLRPTVVFDIGANVGPHSLLIPALLDVEVIAFEPAPDVAAVLRRNVELNGLRCTVVEIALGDRDAEATLFISPTDTSTSLRSGFRPAVDEVSVPVQRLDTFVAERGLRPGVLKIDTETTEPDVLRGAPLLLETRPWIVCEVLPGWTEAAIEDLLRPLGYRLFQIVNSGPPAERAEIAGHTSLEEPNWLFAPDAPVPALWQSIERWAGAVERAGPPQDMPEASRA